ncbi:MAG: arylsulfatase [Pseudomonadales bacterium]
MATCTARRPFRSATRGIGPRRARAPTQARRLRAWAGLALVLLAGGAAAAAAAAAAEQPNFVIILVDDAALMDFGAYGGEARTPHIDALAAKGSVFTQYRTSPLCAPSRAMLLTGVDNHRTGVATIPEVLPRELRGQPGYTMSLEPGVTTIASRLKAAGYRTYMTGKWHLGHGPGALPVDHGFDRSFILDASGADNWEQKPYMPYYPNADWFEDGERARLPDDFYSSEFLVDRMIEYLDSGADGGGHPRQPFFAYLAFQAIHIPVQAPKAYVDGYEGVYDAGWEVLRVQRWQRARDLGLIAADAPLAPLAEGTRGWDALTADERALYAKSMAVNAAMLEAMDHHVGRLVSYLRQQGLYQRTVFVVTSDNGPEPSHPVSQRGFPTWMALNGYDRKLENLGERGSYAFIGLEWALAAASPGALFKFYAAEGGIRVPLIIAAADAPTQPRIDALSFVTDITPTLLDYAGLDPAPDDGTVAITGRSLLPVLRGDRDAVYGPEEAVGIEAAGNAALLRGDHKITRNMPPWGDGEWRLFDIRADPGETRDLSDYLPERKAQLLADYDAYVAEMGVLPLPKGYDMQRQLAANSLAKQIQHFRWQLALAAVVLLGLVWLAWRGSRALWRQAASGG